MSKLIVVIGVTGVQGSSVANTFLGFPEWKVRGITRNPHGPAAQAMTAKGVEVVKGDLDDKLSLFPAFEGATVIFSNTDFFGHLFGVLFSKDIPGGRTPNQYAYDRELEQGLNIAEAAAAPATLQTLERFVLSSLSDASKWSHGKYTHCYHNDVKAEMIRTIHSQFPKLAAQMSTVQIGHYVTNWKQSPLLAPQKQPDGSFLIKRTFSPDFKMPFVVAGEDTGAFVKALVDLPPGKDLHGWSETMTLPEWTKIWGDTLGVKATFKRVSHEEFFEGAPEALKNELEATFKYMDEFGYTGGDPETLEVDQLGFEVPRTSMEKYFKSEDWSSIL